MPALSAAATMMLAARRGFRGAVGANATALLITNSIAHAQYIAPGDQRAEPPYRKRLVEGIGFGLHLVGYSLPLDDLIDAVTQQALTLARM